MRELTNTTVVADKEDLTALILLIRPFVVQVLHHRNIVLAFDAGPIVAMGSTSEKKKSWLWRESVAGARLLPRRAVPARLLSGSYLHVATKQ